LLVLREIGSQSNWFQKDIPMLTLHNIYTKNYKFTLNEYNKHYICKKYITNTICSFF